MKKPGGCTASIVTVLLLFVAPLFAEKQDLSQQVKGVTDLMNAGQLQEAETAVRELLDSLARDVDAGHPSLGTWRYQLGRILVEQGRDQEALEELRQAALTFDTALGPENPFALESRYAAVMAAAKAELHAEAADLAAPLLETLRSYVESGRAGRADWEAVPTLRLLFPDAQPRYDEARVADVTALLGLSLAGAGRNDEAEPVLRDAERRLKEVYGSGHPELVRVTEALEEIALARGDAMGRRYVGAMGHTRSLSFSGNHSFPDDELRRALTQDATFVLASHPAEPFNTLLEVIPRRLRAGYLDAGFPEAKVQATYVASPENPRIAVSIDEGARIGQGAIRVEGVADDVAQTLAKAMQVAADRSAGPAPDEQLWPEGFRQQWAMSRLASIEGPLVERIRKATAEYRKFLPPSPREADTQAMVEALNQQLPSATLGTNAVPPVLLFNRHPQPDWVPGDPAGFKEGEEHPKRNAVRRRLADLGWPMAQVVTRYERTQDGTVDLVVQIDELGPRVVVGSVEVIGNVKNTTEAVREMTGLVPGHPVHPSSLDEATLALWYSCRFFPFTIDVASPRPGAGEVEFTIRVHELNDMPALSDPAPAGFDEAVKLARLLDEGMLDPAALDGDLVVEWSQSEDAARKRLLFALSADAGFYAEFESEGLNWEWPFTNGHVNVACGISRTGGLTALLREVAVGLDLHFGWDNTDFRPSAHILPNPEWESGKGRASFQVGLEFGSAKEEAGGLQFSHLFHPGMVWVEFLKKQVEQGVSLPRDEDGAAVGSPLDRLDSLVRVESNFVHDATERMRGDLSEFAPDRVITTWSGLLVEAISVARDAPRPEEWAEEDHAHYVAFMDVLAKVMEKPEVFAPLYDLYAAWNDKPEDEDASEFSIPFDPSQAAGGIWPVALGMGYLYVTETVLPPDSWASVLARELMFMMSGKTQHTAATLDRLLEDPSMGPFGCVLTAQLLSKFDETTSRRFLARARQQATAEGFEQDWRLFTDGFTRLSDAVEDVLEALAQLEPAEVDQLVAALGDEAAGPLHTLFEHIRNRPPDQPLSDWIAPAMGTYWEEHLEGDFRAWAEKTINPALDAERFAATVNGVPLPRWFVRAQREYSAPIARLALPRGGAAAWAVKEDLARAIRMELLGQGLAARGMQIQREQVLQKLPELLPMLDGADDERWRNVTGLAKQEYVTWIIYHELLLGALRAFEAEAEQPTFEETRTWYETSRKHWGDTAALVHCYAAPAVPLSPKDVARCQKITSALAGWMSKEPVLHLLEAIGKVDPRPGYEIKEQRTHPISDLNPDLQTALDRIQPGGITEPMVLGQVIGTVFWKAMTPGPRPTFESVYMSAAKALQQERVLENFHAWLEQLEAQADIRVLADPASAETDEPTASAFAELLEAHPDSLLGKLGMAWEKGDLSIDAAWQAAELVIASGALDATDLARLCAGFAGAGDSRSARLCLERAAAMDGVAAMKAIEEQIARHAGHTQCKMGETLTKLRRDVEGEGEEAGRVTR